MSRTARLVIVLLLNVGLVAALLVTGLAAHSLAVLAAGADYLADAAAVGVSLAAIWLAARPGGHRSATTIAALVNAGWLAIISTAVAVAATVRLIAGTHRVHGLPVLIVSAVAAVAMTAGALILNGDPGSDGDFGSDSDIGFGSDSGVDGEPGEDDDGGEGGRLNIAAVLLDTVADAAAAAGVAVTGAVIAATGAWFWLDPAVALVISVVIGYHAVRLLVKITRSLRRRASRRD